MTEELKRALATINALPESPAVVPEFSAAEVETIKHLIRDWGWEYSLNAERSDVEALAAKLGVKIP